MFMRRFSLLLTLSILAGFAIAPAANAATKYKTTVGIGDQSPLMFTNPSFKELKLKKVRYFIHWDAIKKDEEIAKADAYVAAARKAKVKVLMHISTNDFTPKGSKLPSVGTYRSNVGKLIKRYRAKGVTEWGAWNEANHKTQPTWDSPSTAAKYFLAMRSLCKGCTVVALDILDQPGDTRYISRWFKALGRKNLSKVTVVGIHNYSDTNRSRSTGTSRILKAVKSKTRRAKFWLTETGGLYGFKASNFDCDPVRQTKSVKYMFTLTKKYRASISRLYSYNFTGTTPEQCEEGLFDAGLVDSAGAPRPAFTAFKTAAKDFAR